MTALQRDASAAEGLELDTAVDFNNGVFKKDSAFVLVTQALVGAPQSVWQGQLRADSAPGGKPADRVDPGKANEAKEAFARRLAEWQVTQGLPGHGMLDDTTVAAVKEEVGEDPKDPRRETFLRWQSVDDSADMADAAEQGERARSTDGDSRRAAIVSLAEGEVGKVSASNRGDGEKVGSDRLIEYYRVGLGPNHEPGLEAQLRAPGLFPGQKFVDGMASPPTSKLGGAWSWCGIFAMWAVRTVTGLGVWDQKPIGLTRFDDPAQAKPGDIIGRMGSLNHHAVVQKVEGDQVTTINGNGVNQEIHVRTEPLSLYTHFYSALPGAGAEEVVAKWESDRAARLAREAAERKAKKR